MKAHSRAPDGFFARRRAAASLAALLLLAAPSPALAQRDAEQHARERGTVLLVEEHLLAPCCWNQTLDIHESALATELRSEIRRRVDEGETAQAIEDDLAARYGERIRAVPRNRDPRSWVVWIVGGAMVATALFLAFALRRWRRHGDAIAAATPSPRSTGAETDEHDYDRRLQDELDQLDEHG